MSLSERLRETPIPDAQGAEERSWEVVRAAHAERRPVHAPARRFRVAAVPAAVVLAVLVLATSGAAIGDWIRDLARPGREHAKPALSSLPAPGRLLVTSPSGPWVVRSDGSKRLLGPYRDATWSPHGLFVAATRGRQLVALEPGGLVRWTLARPHPVSDPRWAPSGYRVAYRTHGSLRVVAGDGSGDRALAHGVAPAPAAWRPGRLHVLAYAGRAGAVHLVAADSGRTLWRSATGERPLELAWSADGRRLVARGPHALHILDDRGRTLRTVRVAATAVAFAPAGHRLAVIRPGAAPAQSEVVLIDAERGVARERPVFAGPGDLTDLAWAPDGRWLLIGWPSADQWLFVRSGSRRVTAVANLGRQFSPGASGAPRFPHVAGWCCAAEGPSG